MSKQFNVVVAAGISFILAGCAAGSDSDPSGLEQGAGDGSVPSTGGASQGSGGASEGTGGSSQGTGGVSQGTGGSGGISQGTGGISQGTGGIVQGTGGIQGTGGVIQGTGGDQQGTGGTVGSSVPPCLTNPGTQAIIMGDSYVTGFLTPALQPSLVALYPTAQQFPNYAQAGFSMGSGGLGLIPPQFDTASAVSSEIKFVIMTGGGNDVLLCDAAKYPNCKTVCLSAGSSTNSMCQQIVQTGLQAATDLMMKMADHGVKDVVYFFYPHIPPGGALSGPEPNEILDYAYTQSGPACDGAYAASGGKLTCHFIDLRQPFADNGGYINISGDGVHPTQSGQDIIAGEIWRVMQEDCLGMTSGCCAM